jgi:transcription antitermination factor NusA-like protein
VLKKSRLLPVRDRCQDFNQAFWRVRPNQVMLAIHRRQEDACSAAQVVGLHLLVWSDAIATEIAQGRKISKFD